MAEDTSSQRIAVQSSGPTKNGILDHTLGDAIQSNPQAQQLIMRSMGISQEQFQNMLNSAQQNNLMHMKIGDLFKNGIVQQAIQQSQSGNTEQGSEFVSNTGQISQVQQLQLTPEQMQQLQNGTLSPQQLIQQGQPVQQKTSFLDKLRKWLK